MKISNILQKILLWIIVFPIFIIVQTIIIWFNNFAFTDTYDISGRSIETSTGFAGHHFIGPLFVFYSYSLATAGGIYVVVKIFKNYPKHGKVAFFAIAAITCLAAFGSAITAFIRPDIPFESKIRLIINAISFIFGVCIAGSGLKLIKFNRLTQ